MTVVELLKRYPAACGSIGCSIARFKDGPEEVVFVEQCPATCFFANDPCLVPLIAGKALLWLAERRACVTPRWSLHSETLWTVDTPTSPFPMYGEHPSPLEAMLEAIERWEGP